jgi:YaiO family outer membrane protein
MNVAHRKALLLSGGVLVLTLFADAGASAASGVSAAIEREDYAVAAALLRAELAAAPDDEMAQFTLARVLAWAGDHTAALAQYDALIAAHPVNVDYSLGRAHVLAWTGRDEAALSELARARSLAPDYADVWRLELALLARRDDSAVRLRELRSQAAARFPASDWWQDSDEHESTAPATAETELAFGSLRERLSNGAPDWTSSFVQVSRRGNEGALLYGAIRREERFDRSDSIVAGGAGWHVLQRWSLGFDLDLGSNVDFVPRVAATAWAQLNSPGGWETQFRLRQRDYGDVDVTSAAVTLGRYFGDFRAAYTLDISRLQGAATSAGHSATLSFYATDRTQLNVTVAAGDEAETIGPGRVLRMDVGGYSLGLRHTLNDRWRLSGSLGSHRQGDFYTRRYVGFSVSAGL